MADMRDDLLACALDQDSRKLERLMYYISFR